MSLRKRLSSVPLAIAVVSTVTTARIQSRPPFPDDPDRSNTRASHSPMELGAEIDTFGETALAELVTKILTTELELGQVDVSQLLVRQCAFSDMAVSAIVTGESTAAHSKEGSTKALTVLLLVHRQVEESAQVNSNSELHVKRDGSWPRSVAVSNVIAT